MNLKEARDSFPGLADKVFLDAGCVSLAPRQAQEGINSFMDMAVHCYEADASLHHIAMDQLRQEPIDEAAKLLNANPAHIALIESTTHGLNIAANAIPFNAGDNILIASTEFLQVAIPWAKKKETVGLEIKPVQSGPNGSFTLADFEATIDDHTKAICVSSVQWCSGYRLDMTALGDLCRQRGIWLVVDAIHEVGAMQVDVQQQYSDFFIAGGHKWLNAPYGCGLMHLSERVLSELQPNSYGYLTLSEPEGGWGEYFRTPSITPYRPYEFPATAKTFEIGGTANYPGAVGLGKSLKLINQVGPQVVEDQIRHLTDFLWAELEKTNARIITHPAPKARSGITVFNYLDTPAQDLALVEKILEHKVYISIRYTANIGGIRISTHFFNNEDDILKLIETLKVCASR